MMENIFKMTFTVLLFLFCFFPLVQLNYFEQDKESLSCSYSRLFLPIWPQFLVSYSSLEQDQSKYPASR